MSFIPQRISVGTISSVTGTTGTGAAGRVAYWSDATTLTSSASFLFDGTSLQVPDGAVGTPSLSFSGDTDTGFYRSAANVLAVAAGGARCGAFYNGGYQAETASAAAPGISFIGDETTGFYRLGAGSIGIASGGSAIGKLGLDVSFTSPTANPLIIKALTANSNGLRFYANTATDVATIVNGYNAALELGANNTVFQTIAANGLISFGNNVTVTSSGGPQYIAKDGGSFGTNADPHIQFEDTTGSGGRIGFTDGASKDLKIQNQTDTGILDFVTTATQIAGSAGAATGTYWTIKLGGTTYKLALLANA